MLNHATEDAPHQAVPLAALAGLARHRAVDAGLGRAGHRARRSVQLRCGHPPSRDRVGRQRRPARSERRRALFDFMYQTYQSSAWIPQSLFDSNLVTQAVVGDVDTIVGEKVGLVLWRDNPLVPAFGMAPNADARTPGDSPNTTAPVDRQLPGLPHGGDRRRRLLRRGHQDVRRALARRGAEAADERPLARAAATRFGRLRAGRGGPSDSEQPSPRQDRFAHARPVHGVRGIARRAVHANARQHRCRRSTTSAGAT